MSNIDDAWERNKPRDFLRADRQLNHPIRGMILEHAEGKTVGDFGCASCIDYPMWIKHGYDYTGIDFTEKFLDYAKSLYPEIKLIKSDIINTGLPDEAFSTSYCKDIFEHQPPEKYIQVLDEMWRLASKVMIIAFYIAPKDKPTHYELVNGIHYKNHYNKDEILDALLSYKPISVEIHEHIGYNNSTLYVVKKNVNTS